jgi:hypothetical protein
MIGASGREGNLYVRVRHRCRTWQEGDAFLPVWSNGEYVASLIDRPVVFLTVGLVIAGANFIACDTGFDGPDKIESNWTTEDARRFDEFPLYWLGDSYEGLPLTATYRHKTEAVDVVGFVYGESKCDLSGCRAQLWIRIEPYCYYPREFIDGSSMKIRGADAEFVDLGLGEALRVFTGDLSLGIDSEKTEVAVTKVGRDLIPIAEDAGATPKPLPPPVSTEC